MIDHDIINTNVAYLLLGFYSSNHNVFKLAHIDKCYDTVYLLIEIWVTWLHSDERSE